MFPKLLSNGWRLNAKISSEKLDVASRRLVRKRQSRNQSVVFQLLPTRAIAVSVMVTAADSRQYWQKW